ncbi:MAG TPA: hypothetical protein VMT69_08045 [Kineosporiaceae bacterium]|nr:hypothetical protein [Kineosporiaceae bacterium]
MTPARLGRDGRPRRLGCRRLLLQPRLLQGRRLDRRGLDRRGLDRRRLDRRLQGRRRDRLLRRDGRGGIPDRPDDLLGRVLDRGFRRPSPLLDHGKLAGAGEALRAVDVG